MSYYQSKSFGGRQKNKKSVCKTDEYGTKRWYLNDQHYQLHREDGPAIEYANGDKLWYLNGQCHREDGPAREFANGNKFWYLNGRQYSEAEYHERLNNDNL